MNIADWCESARNWVCSDGARVGGQSAGHLISVEKTLSRVVELCPERRSFPWPFLFVPMQKIAHWHWHLRHSIDRSGAGFDGLEAARAFVFLRKLRADGVRAMPSARALLVASLLTEPPYGCLGPAGHDRYRKREESKKTSGSDGKIKALALGSA
ncbi:hypothetical protein ABIF70_005110 [Bradyrhizobium japonicum]